MGALRGNGVGKDILIFSDGTGQFGGLKPDQRLSNVYKMYRAMRPGPESPIRYTDQIAYYNPGLGAGEVQGWSFRRIRNFLAAAVGTGIDDNIIDCYTAIMQYYEPGDRVLLFGFSRGAYTVRSLANVMHLCGVPTRMPDWSALPPSGPRLRSIARDAVKSVYGHGAGMARDRQPYLEQRLEKGRRFRAAYGSEPPPDEENIRGNVQPDFIGVFDTVAALDNAAVSRAFGLAVTSLFALAWVSQDEQWPAWITIMLAVLGGFGALWFLGLLASQIRFFEPDPAHPLRWYRPWDWPRILKYTHFARWSRKNYDRWLDETVGHARHALSIDENRADFAQVDWFAYRDLPEHHVSQPPWLEQVWFAGCHSDIGGSYLELESRLSDIALQWMVAELERCRPGIRVRHEILHTSPDTLGQQHEERVFEKIGAIAFRWRVRPRTVDPAQPLHPSVIARLEADQVPHPDAMRPYRPEPLRHHPQASKYYSGKDR